MKRVCRSAVRAADPVTRRLQRGLFVCSPGTHRLLPTRSSSIPRRWTRTPANITSCAEVDATTSMHRPLQPARCDRSRQRHHRVPPYHHLQPASAVHDHRSERRRHGGHSRQVRHHRRRRDDRRQWPGLSHADRFGHRHARRQRPHSADPRRQQRQWRDRIHGHGLQHRQLLGPCCHRGKWSRLSHREQSYRCRP